MKTVNSVLISILLISSLLLACSKITDYETSEIPVEYYSIFDPFVNGINLQTTEGISFNLISYDAEIRRFTNMSVIPQGMRPGNDYQYMEWEQYTHYTSSSFFNLEMSIGPSYWYSNWSLEKSLNYIFKSETDTTLFNINLAEEEGLYFLQDSLIQLYNDNFATLWISKSRGIVYYRSSQFKGYFHEDYVDFINQ